MLIFILIGTPVSGASQIEAHEDLSQDSAGRVENIRFDLAEGGVVRVFYISDEDVWMTGFSADTFLPFLRIGNRVELGALVGGGLAGHFGGTVQRRTDDLSGQNVVIERVATKNLYRATGWDVTPPLLARAELATTFSVHRRIKLRASGGLNLPGIHLFGVEIVHLFGVPGGR